MVDCDWSNLPEELLRLIAARLFSVVELKRFRSICTSWRSSISGADKNNPFPSRGLIHFDPCLNTEGSSNQFYTSLCLVILSRTAFFRVTPSFSSNKGWLIKSDTKINSGKFRLLDPFSRLSLPHSCESLDLLEFTVSEIQEAYAVFEKSRGRTAREFKKVVYKMDEELAKWKEVKSLGDNAFVMATDTCFSVLAHEFYGCLQNSIYFTDNEEKVEKVIKVFKLDNATLANFGKMKKKSQHILASELDLRHGFISSNED
ncbi:unnamed protein product [Arabidopsis halleri]